MATQPEVNPFAQFVETPKAEPDTNPFAKYLQISELEEATKKYEEEVPFLQRITDPLKAGVAKLPGILPGVEVSSIQKQINAIREGKGGPRDPITGESLPFQPEEASAAIDMLQSQQAEAQKKVMAAQAESGQYRTRPAVAALTNAKTAREAFDLFQVDPLGVMSSVSLESLPQMGPALVLGAVTRNPTVGALAMGSTSFAGELSSGITEYFQDKGVDVKDPIAVNKALNDPALFAKAYEHSLTRASIIGTLDTAAAGLASKMLVPKQIIKNQFAKEAANIGVAQPVAQMISGGGGEALAQITTEGEITKPGQVLMEAAGEGPSSVLETAAFGGKEAIDRLRGVQPPVTTPDVAPPTVPGAPPVVAGVTPPVTPTAPIVPATPLAQGLDAETAQRIKMRLDQMDNAQVPVVGRTVNPLAKDLGLNVPKGQRPEQTYIQIKEALGLPTEPVSPTEAAVPETEFEAPEEQAIPPAAQQILPPPPVIAETFPMGGNSDYLVVKNDNGWSAVLFDKDAEQAVSTKVWPTEQFGEDGREKAIEFAKAEAEKAAKYLPQEEVAPTPTEVVQEPVQAEAPAVAPEVTAAPEIAQEPEIAAPEVAAPVAKPTKEEQIAINKARQEENKAAAEAAKPSKEDVAEKKMLDAIESTKKVKGSAKDFIAKHGKAMFDRAKNDGYIDNEANDQRLFSTNKLEELYSKYYDPKRYAEMLANREKFAEKTVVEMPAAEPTVQVTPNKIFTEDAATKARNRLRSKLNQFNSGIDPEFLIDGITLSGYHIEKGARTFAAYAKAMVDDLGDKVIPYLKSWYMGVKFDPRAAEFMKEMDDEKGIDSFSFDKEESIFDPDTKFKIAQDIAQHFAFGNSFKDILEARKFIAEKTGKKIEAGTPEAKEADEAIEVGVVLAARKIIDKGRSDSETYDGLVNLYNQQPNLSVRSSTSVREQAYSTPAPLAYVASKLAGINKDSTVYEPTAGNGMLLIDSNPNNVRVNELNASRYEMLKKVFPKAEITNENALDAEIPSKLDSIIANPPFGVVKDKNGKSTSFNIEGYRTNEIDHAIVFNSLKNLKENGRATLIVGGVMGEKEDARREGYRSKAKRAFYYKLYKEYNVVDHFTVAGDMYKKQGAAYPVDVIVISGKVGPYGSESTRKLPAAQLPKVISSYEQLKEKLNETSRMESRPAGVTRPDSGVGETRPSERKPVATGAIKPSATTGEEGTKPTGGAQPSVSTTPAADTTERKPSGAGISGKEPTTSDVSELQQPEQKPVSSASEGVGPRVGGITGGNKPTGLGGTSGTVNERVRSAVKEEETQYQITYIPKSKLKSVETLMPKGMADAIRRSLDRLEKKVGDIDTYVANSLEMDLGTLGDYFSAEQVDALALSINNAEKGKGFIIGDQTGIGKGRVVAGMIKYAIVNGKIPIFVTEKTNLYADMIRDLNEIGMADFLDLNSNKQRILMTNGGQKDKVPYTFIVDEDGKKVEKDYLFQAPKKGKAQGNLLDGMVKDNDIGNYKVIFSTYDQMKTVKKGATTPRREFLRHFANDNYVILDESHNAGGTGTPDPKKENVAKFARALITSSFGSFFSSATYAKRANVMDLYASTDMSLAVDNIEELAAAIQYGGVPMQQVVATMLAEAGQYIRREKSFEGITYEAKEVAIDKEIAENMATTLRNVLSFSSAKESVVDSIKEDEDESGGVVVGGDLVKSEVEGDNFAATMHNLIGQMLLGLKADQAAKYAIERLKAGEKVVLTVSNTMGSFLNDFAKDMGLRSGDPVDLSFKDLFIKYLEKQRIVKIKNEFGEAPEYIDGVKEVYLTDDMLGHKLLKSYNNIKEQIENADYGTAPISPIDYMQALIQKAGYKTSEITGRKLIINYNAPTPVLDSRDSGIMERLKSISEFNNSDLDVMILNRAGSTGLSLHSSKNFKNQKKRHMIVVQADADIAVHFQMLGRVNRTGQVNKPTYTQLGGDIPAENRPMAVLAKKMASLNANTTAGQKSSLTAENVVDFVNDYGGQVAQEFLMDNPWFNETIGNRIKVLEDSIKGTEEDIRRLTGFIPVFPIKQQEEIYQDLLERFNSLIELVNSMGTNKLEAKAMDLDAKTISKKQITEDKGGDSPFAKPAYMERIDVKRTVKPLSSKEVSEMAQKNLEGKSNVDIAKNFKFELRKKVDEYKSAKTAEMLEKNSDPVAINKFQKQTDLTQSHIETILDNYRIGDSISLKDPESQFTYGVIVNISQKGKTANPAAASAWKMQIALANGEVKSLTLSFSQIGTSSGFTLSRENIVDYINMQTGERQNMRITDIFDAGSEERREKRWMVTGNLLSGYANYPGQIVVYRKEDGTEGQGILMSRLFDFEKAEKEAPVKIKTVEDAMRFLTEVGGALGSKDGVLRIEMRGGQIAFDVPKSKKVGGAYFLDARLTNALGKDFYQRGQSMVSYVYGEDAKAALNYLLNEKQEGLVALTKTDKAREMFAPVAPVKSMSRISNQNENSEIVAQKVNAMKEKTKYSPTGLKADELVSWANNARNIGAISDEVFNVIDYLAKKSPNVLNGLKLQIRPESLNSDANYETAGEMIGNIVSLYAGTKGVRNPATLRHELTHALEMAMSKEAKEKLVGDWRKKLDAQEAAEKTDEGKQFFKAVRVFLALPSESRFEDAVRAIPEGQYEKYYQLISPSEFWAINAEPMMKAFLGGAWKRFQNFVKGLFEALKNVIGMDNQNDIHRLFNDVINKPKISKEMLNDYINSTAPKKSIAPKEPSNINDLLVKHKRNHTPINPDPSTLDKMMGIADLSKIRNMTLKDGVLIVPKMVGQIDRGITYVLNKNVWFGKGLEVADIQRYNGQLRDGNNRAVASVAVTNALRGGHIGTRVLTQGSLVFDPVFQMFKAQKSKFSMANVIEAKAKLAKSIGLQESTDVINQYLEAKRSKSIINEYLARQQTYQDSLDSGEDVEIAAKQLKDIERAFNKISMSDEAIEEFGALNKEYPELNTIMENWTKVNHNQLDMQLFSGLISKARHKQLKDIQDYVPWQRIMDDMEDLHTERGMKNVRGMTNVAQPKAFQKGKTDRQIDDILHNMIVNVVTMSRNSARNYAANRVAQEYATRNQRNRIKVFPKEGVMSDGSVRVNIVMNGRRVIIEIQDPLIAESVLGMESLDIPVNGAMAFIANGLRRSVTINPIFQIRQMWMDSKTAALVSGVKNPAMVWAETFNGFVQSLKPNDPIVSMMKDFGVGGYQSYARSPEKELKLEIGIINNSKFNKLIKALDHVGDASDYGQRRAVYKRVLKETGDPLQAMLQANNVIDFLKRGSSSYAQFFSRNVAFMNAYAQQINVLAETLTGGGLKGKSREKALGLMVWAMSMLASTSILYAFAVGDDDEYNQLDDQTKMRNYFIPKSVFGKSLLIPMNTSAAYFDKAIPEMIVNKIRKEGTKYNIDNTRLATALKDGAMDSLLGPNPIPTALKPGVEIMFNHNFLTGGSITPRSLQSLEAFRQYTADTSELGKMLSAMTPIPLTDKRALNPIEADHFVRSLTGTVGAAVMWGSNMFSGDRVAPEDRKNPLYGAFIAREVPRGREDLYYDLLERANEKYATFQDLNKKQRSAEAQEYFKENKGLIIAHGYTSGVETPLKKINAEIRRVSDLPASKMSSEAKRERMTELQNIKNNTLKDVIEIRKKAGL
jgi:hypothetical protein